MHCGQATAKSQHLSVVARADDNTRLTRAQVADRIGASVSTVRRYEGERLHSKTDENGVNWFDPKEVTALAAWRANQGVSRGRSRNVNTAEATSSDTRTRGELAALMFERFEQRQSLAEIVVGLRVEPELVRELFDQWCLGLTEGQLRKREPNVPLEADIERARTDTLARRLAELPEGEITRISVGRWRGVFQAGEDLAQYAWFVELGGFLVSGPCTPTEITRRYGCGSYRVTAYAFEPSGLRWELLVEDLGT